MELNFDEEALKLFRKLNLSAAGAGQASAPGVPSRYNPLDPVFMAVDCRPEEERLDEYKKPVMVPVYPPFIDNVHARAASVYQDKGNNMRVFVGNQTAAGSADMLLKHNIRYVVNCTFGKSGIPNFFEGRELGGKRMHYLVFPVGHWSLDVGPSDEELLEFVTPLFDFIELAWKKKSNVLVHCLAGAHRAGTTGCLCLMKYAGLAPHEAITVGKMMRPVIDPIGTLPGILSRFARARVKYGNARTGLTPTPSASVFGGAPAPASAPVSKTVSTRP